MRVSCGGGRPKSAHACMFGLGVGVGVGLGVGFGLVGWREGEKVGKGGEAPALLRLDLGGYGLGLGKG